MKEIFSTAGLHARDRFDCWHEVACREFVGHRSRPVGEQGFDASLTDASLEGLPLLLLQNSPMDVTRARKDIVNAQSDDLYVCVQMSGTQRLEQLGRQVTLQDNDFCLIDPMVPYRGCFRDASRLLVAKIGRRALEARVGNTSMFIAMPLRISASGHLTSEFLRALPKCLDMPRYEASVLKESAIDLIGLSLSAAFNKAGATTSSSRAIAVMKLRAAIADRLASRHLSPPVAAAAAGMSVRYANAVLAEQGTSLGRLIVSSRLERCRAALDDPALAHRTVTELALAWGFADASHFSHVFRRAYQMSPTEYRRQWQLASKPKD